MEHPSTPGAPLLSLTFSHACHTSAFEISNGLPDDFSSLTRLLPDLSPVDRTNMPRMTWPLRFTPTATAGTSPLLRASPPAHPHRYSIPPLSDVRDSPSRRPGGAAVSGHAFSRSIRAQPGRAHVAFMPDTTQAHPGTGSNPRSWFQPSFFHPFLASAPPPPRPLPDPSTVSLFPTPL